MNNCWGSVIKKYPEFYEFMYGHYESKEFKKREQYMIKFLYIGEIKYLLTIVQNETCDKDITNNYIYNLRLFILRHSLRINHTIIYKAMELYEL